MKVPRTFLRAALSFWVVCWAAGFARLVWFGFIPWQNVFDCIGLGACGVLLFVDAVRYPRRSR